MTTRSTVFNSFRKRQPTDTSPDALTVEELQHIDDRLSAGCAPRFGIVRKLMRLVEARREVALIQQARIDSALAILAEGHWSDWGQRATKALKGEATHPPAPVLEPLAMVGDHTVEQFKADGDWQDPTRTEAEQRLLDAAILAMSHLTDDDLRDERFMLEPAFKALSDAELARRGLK